MDKEVYLGLKKVLDQDLEAALITVTHVRGSTPRKPGAKMLVFSDGTTVGTIGGGCGEAEGRREALNVLTSFKPKLYPLNMTADIALEEGMVCGGIMELFIDYIGSQSQVERTNLKVYLSELESGSNPLSVNIIEANDEGMLGKKLIIKDNGEVLGDLGFEALNRVAVEYAKTNSGRYQPLVINLDSDLNPCEPLTSKTAFRLLIEPPITAVKLLILGAGHIALPLATMAKMIGYEVTVVDDRMAFANSFRFNTADTVICDDFERALDRITIDHQTYIVIITRGHRYDKVCLRKVINQSASYIGMIGSRKRVKALVTDLEEEGISRESLAKLHSPIGLKIGAETPEEIAVSIISEVIMVQKQLDHDRQLGLFKTL